MFVQLCSSLKCLPTLSTLRSFVFLPNMSLQSPLTSVLFTTEAATKIFLDLPMNRNNVFIQVGLGFKIRWTNLTSEFPLVDVNLQV